MDWKKILLLALLVWGGWHWHQTRPLSNIAAGSAVERAPSQTSTDLPAFNVGKYALTPLARFNIEARILSRKEYSADKEADLAPVDLALGWGRMSDVAVYSQLKISQGGRFYYWRYDNEPPIPYGEIVRSSANMHLIPADAQIEAMLRETRPGQIIRIAGYLVQAKDASGWTWRSSLSREDSGAGACELIWVEAVAFVESR